MQYPYLFANRSDQILREKGLMFEEASMMAQTRPKAREAAKAVAGTALSDVDGGSQSQEAEIENSSAVEPQEFGSAQSEVPVIAAADLLEDELPDLFVAPTSEGLQRRSDIGSSALIRERETVVCRRVSVPEEIPVEFPGLVSVTDGEASEQLIYSIEITPGA